MAAFPLQLLTYDFIVYIHYIYDNKQLQHVTAIFCINGTLVVWKKYNLYNRIAFCNTNYPVNCPPLLLLL